MSVGTSYETKSAVDDAVLDAWLWMRREVESRRKSVDETDKQLAMSRTKLEDAEKRLAELTVEVDVRGLRALGDRILARDAPELKSPCELAADARE